MVEAITISNLKTLLTDPPTGVTAKEMQLNLKSVTPLDELTCSAILDKILTIFFYTFALAGMLSPTQDTVRTAPSPKSIHSLFVRGLKDFIWPRLVMSSQSIMIFIHFFHVKF